MRISQADSGDKIIISAFEDDTKLLYNSGTMKLTVGSDTQTYLHGLDNTNPKWALISASYGSEFKGKQFYLCISDSETINCGPFSIGGTIDYSASESTLHILPSSSGNVVLQISDLRVYNKLIEYSVLHMSYFDDVDESDRYLICSVSFEYMPFMMEEVTNTRINLTN